MRVLKPILLGLACLVILPSAAFTQASITAVVKDSSGAVLPGVAVEASSDVLIERARSAVTDGSGTYNQAFSPTTTAWLTPTSVLQPRFWKFSAQVDF